MNKKLLAKIRANANKARLVDFAKMRQYAIERHEDTLDILIGLSLEIEKLRDICMRMSQSRSRRSSSCTLTSTPRTSH